MLNILFIGAFIGHFSQRISTQLFLKLDIAESIEKLPEHKQELVFSTLKDLKTETSITKKKISKNQKDILESLTAPEFDPKQFDEHLIELHMTFGELTIEIADAIKKIAANLNQDERKQLAEIIEKRHRNRNYGHSDWRHD